MPAGEEALDQGSEGLASGPDSGSWHPSVLLLSLLDFSVYVEGLTVSDLVLSRLVGADAEEL